MTSAPPTDSPMSTRPSPSVQIGVALGALGSLIVHGGLVALILTYGSAPSLGFELQLPLEVEFGMSGAMELPGGATPTPAPAEPVTPAVASGEGESAGGASDAGVSADASVEDAGRRRRRDAGGESDAAVDSDAEAGDAAMLVAAAEGDGDAGADASAAQLASADGDAGAGHAAGSGGGAGGPGLAAYAPPGAQLALRIDLVRLRQSPLAPEVRALLAAVPDWHAILDGSGIEPLDDLERLLIASPNLQRSRLVMSGRYVGDETKVREAVARMAAARGETPRWRRERGFDVARWPNIDATERVIALVGPHAFTITRDEDLPRVIAVARERRREAERLAQAAGTPVPDDADALLSMAEGEVLSIEVEGARAFVRGGPTESIPTRLRAAARELAAGRVEVVADGHFESANQATAAREFWDGMRATYARNALVALVGLGSALDHATIEVEGDTLHFRTELTPRQIALVLRYARGMLERPRAPAGGAPSGAPVALPRLGEPRSSPPRAPPSTPAPAITPAP